MTTERTPKKVPAEAGKKKGSHAERAPTDCKLSADDRFNARINRVFLWAMSQNHETLARHFADLWAVDQLTQRANRLHRAAASHVETAGLAKDEIQRRKKTKGARARWEKDPAALSMREVRKEWSKWQATTTSSFPSDAAFARAMALKYPDITSEASIKNACSRWRKESK